jgi:hypothetical protein
MARNAAKRNGRRRRAMALMGVEAEVGEEIRAPPYIPTALLAESSRCEVERGLERGMVSDDDGQGGGALILGRQGSTRR